MTHRTGGRAAGTRLAVTALVSALVTVLLTGLGSPAGASTTAPVDALTTHTAFQAVAAADAARHNLSHPNITCATPLPTGSQVSSEMQVLMVSVAKADAYTGTGHCVSATGEWFTVTTRLEVEYFDDVTDRWIGTGCTRSGSGRSLDGVGTAVVPPAVCELPDAASGQPRRIHAWVGTNRFPDTYEGVSPIYTYGYL